MLRNAFLLGILGAVALAVIYLAGLVRAAVSPNEPYAAHIGLSLDQCVVAQSAMTETQAYTYCARPTAKRQ